MNQCGKPIRKVEVDGDSLRITLVDCNNCERCKATTSKATTSKATTSKTTTSKKRSERTMKRAFWRYKSQQREVVEIIHLE